MEVEVLWIHSNDSGFSFSKKVNFASWNCPQLCLPGRKLFLALLNIVSHNVANVKSVPLFVCVLHYYVLYVGLSLKTFRSCSLSKTWHLYECSSLVSVTSSDLQVAKSNAVLCSYLCLCFVMFA